MNQSNKLLFLFALIALLVINVDFTQAQPNSSRRNKNKTTTVATPQVANKSDVLYDFDKLRSSDNFRGIPWGATKEQILSLEPSERKETGEDYLVLSGQLGEDINVDIAFFFWRSHFIKGTYITTDSFNDYAGYLEKYEYFKRVMIKKYGQPKIDLRNWSDVSLKNKPDRWLLALSKGHVKQFAIWQKDNIVIQIELGAVNTKPAVKIEYYIDNFDSEMQQVDDTDILRDL